MPIRGVVIGIAFVALIAFIVTALTLSSGGDGGEQSAEDLARNTVEANSPHTPVEGDTAISTEGDKAPSEMGAYLEDALSEMTVQPNDLPSGFVLQQDRFYTRDELFRELPTTTQVNEKSLKYALHRTFLKHNDTHPEKVDVFVYVYGDAQGAAEAHESLRAEGAGATMMRLIDGQEPHDYTAMYSGSIEGLGEDSVSYDVKINTQSSNPIHALVFGMRHANVRAEVAAIMRANPHLLPDDVARSQLIRIEQGSLTSN